MKTKTKIVILASTAAIIIGGAIAVTQAGNRESFFSKWGKVLSNNSVQTYSDDLYAVGNNTSITQKDYEQTLQFQLLSGLEQKEAEKEAYRYVTEREALYYQAVKAGYSVTEEEVRDYIEILKQMVEEAENREDIQQLIEQFDSEEAYWEYEVSVYMKNLPIQNYVESLQTDFYKQISSDETGSETAWDEYFDALKQKYAAEEEYKLVQ